MSAFVRALKDRASNPARRRWLFVSYDQLSDGIGPLSREDPRELGIVLVESPWKAERRPYHRHKLAFLLANLRHFALEQAERGVAVRHIVVDGPYRAALTPLVPELGPLRAMLPAERELRVDLAPLVKSGGLEFVAHEGWLTTRDDFYRSLPTPPYRMDRFYRHVRRTTGILMNADGRPTGGKLSFDVENRLPYRGHPRAPKLPSFQADEVTIEVGELIERRFIHHPGELALHRVVASRSDIKRFWKWVQRECLPQFGPFEDAMATASASLFHSRISGLMNLHRLLPRDVVRDVLTLPIPMASREGFVRQVLGWREFMHHVHDATDGLREVPAKYGLVGWQSEPGDGGYARWAGRPWPSSGARHPREALVPADDGGAVPTGLDAHAGVFPGLWGRRTGLFCMDRIVEQVWSEAYSHHITRLMVISNLASLLDISPRELCDWFWVAYFDAYDWVVEPNVMAMGTYGVRDLCITKPYIAGAAYIDRMSDYCRHCAFDPKTSCPFTPLYWAFLARHDRALETSPRMRLPLISARRRSTAQQVHDQRVFDWVRTVLDDGRELKPGESP